ncbi:MAG: hypothetical protein H6618_07430 [Deltaproteobacteria bacterium]|nr:hypothetical protein [Deltaproteobacteria bacterium]
MTVSASDGKSETSVQTGDENDINRGESNASYVSSLSKGQRENLLALAQNIMDKQENTQEGLCQKGECLTDPSVCSALDFGEYHYTLSKDGSRCEMDEVASCHSWEIKTTRKVPAWNEQKKRWIAFDIDVCEADPLKCHDADLGHNGLWYRSYDVELTTSEFFDEKGNFYITPSHSGKDEILKQKEGLLKKVFACEQTQAFCKDHYGEMSTAEHTLSPDTYRSQNRCSVSPLLCREKGLFLNPVRNKSASTEDGDASSDSELKVMKNDCVAQDSVVADRDFCQAHDMEFDELSSRCYEHNERSCHVSGKVWIPDQGAEKMTSLLESYQALNADAGSDFISELSSSGFSYLDMEMQSGKKSIALKGWFPLEPGKQCQQANIETCRIIGKTYDPYIFSCVSKLKRNLLLVIRTLEIDGSSGCLDRRENPDRQVSLGSTESFLMGMDLSSDDAVSKEEAVEYAPFSYEINNVSLYSSTGMSADGERSPVREVAIPQRKSYAFLLSRIFPVEITENDFSFDIRFDVFVKGKSLGASGKVLFASELKTFRYTELPYRYLYQTLIRSADDKKHLNQNGISQLYTELQPELSEASSAIQNTNQGSILPSWFQSRLRHIDIQDLNRDSLSSLPEFTAADSQTRLAYPLYRNNWDESLHKMTDIVHFQSGGGDICFGRMVWSWRWFR